MAPSFTRIERSKNTGHVCGVDDQDGAVGTQGGVSGLRGPGVGFSQRWPTFGCRLDHASPAHPCSRGGATHTPTGQRSVPRVSCLPPGRPTAYSAAESKASKKSGVRSPRTYEIQSKCIYFLPRCAQMADVATATMNPSATNRRKSRQSNISGPFHLDDVPLQSARLHGPVTVGECPDGQQRRAECRRCNHWFTLPNSQRLRLRLVALARLG